MILDPSEFPHTAAVWRESSSTSGLVEAISSMVCLLEPSRPYRRNIAPGEDGGFQYCLSWGTEVLKDQDQILISSKWYDCRLKRDDTHRPADMTTIQAYQTADLRLVLPIAEFLSISVTYKPILGYNVHGEPKFDSAKSISAKIAQSETQSRLDNMGNSRLTDLVLVVEAVYNDIVTGTQFAIDGRTYRVQGVRTGQKLVSAGGESSFRVGRAMSAAVLQEITLRRI